MSKAKAYLSVTPVAKGVCCSDVGVEKSSSWRLANSMAAATECASLGSRRDFGGTTSVGAFELRATRVASYELRRRKVLGLFGGRFSG